MNKPDLRKLLLDLEKRSRVKLALTGEGPDIKVRGRRVQEVRPDFSPEELIGRRDRILAGRFPAMIRESMRRQGISYYAINENELFLVENEIAILLRPYFEKRRTERGRKLQTGFTPTDIISPMGLPIADTLLRLTESDLQSSFRSANQFAKEFHLYQPKLSRMMMAVGARSLGDLAVSLKSLTMEWWDIALSFPSARRQLHPFFSIAKPYHLSDSKKLGELRKRLESSLLKEEDLYPGPLTAAIATGHFIEDVADFWVLGGAAPSQKKAWRLLPGMKPGYPTVWVAEAVKPFGKEGLLSPLALWDQRQQSARSPVHQNLLRAVWDLYQGDSRQRSAGREILKDILR